MSPLIPLRQGWPFILAFVALGFFFLWKDFLPGAVPAFLLSAFMAFFFRNPRRVPPEGDEQVVSPADGRVIAVRDGTFPDGKGAAKVISIFMSLWDVHVNRSPVDCTVLRVEHRGGRFLPAFKDRASRENERNLIFAEGPQGLPLAIVQVAGVLARRILCWVKPGQRMVRGAPFGAIVLGSRVDLHLPPQVSLLVREGQRLKGGKTVIALWRGDDGKEG